MQIFGKISRLDKILIISLVLAFIFCLHGITWGRVEEWHPDQMAFIKLHHDGELPLNPKWFHKPPFHAYFNFFLSILPFKILQKVFHLPIATILEARLVWSRILTAFLFLGSIALVFEISQRFFGIFPARIVTIVFATSAGCVAFSHFLTTDIPLTFWMLLAFYFAQNILITGKFSNYILAGFFTGIATSTKYNGLAVGIAIVVAHALSVGFTSPKQIFNKKLILGLSMVVIGFFVGNPFAIIDYRNFIADFMFNYIVTPVYDANTGHSYWTFFYRFNEIIGIPGVIVFIIAFLGVFYLACKSQLTQYNKNALILLLSVFILYYYKFADFPRLPTRFVLPVVPFCLIASGPFWNKFKQNRLIIGIILVALIDYNIVNCIYIGKRFLEDPRMIAQVWVQKNITPNSTIESTRFSPKWNKLAEAKLTDIRMPNITVRDKFFKEQFKDNSWVIKHKSLNTKEYPKWYTLEELLQRNPDYIAINYRYYNQFFNRLGKKYCPEINKYFVNLIAEKYPYRIVFDSKSPAIPNWIYPQEIDALWNRMIIFQKNQDLRKNNGFAPQTPNIGETNPVIPIFGG